MIVGPTAGRYSRPNRSGRATGTETSRMAAVTNAAARPYRKAWAMRSLAADSSSLARRGKVADEMAMGSSSTRVASARPTL